MRPAEQLAHPVPSLGGCDLPLPTASGLDWIGRDGAGQHDHVELMPVGRLPPQPCQSLVLASIQMAELSSRLALGRGIYTVPETCRILRRGMTSRKIHYWLKHGLLREPVRRGSRGTAVLLSFEQVLRVKTLQRIRDELRFSLPRAREALAWIVENLVADEDHWQELHFFRSGTHIGVGYRDGSGFLEIGTAQSVLPLDEDLLAMLTSVLADARQAWNEKAIDVEGFDDLHSNALVLAGAPVIKGTRIETEFIANLAQELGAAEIHRDLFPEVPVDSIRQAAAFEGMPIAA